MLNFVQVGVFDPYSDDPRFAVKKVVMCGYTAVFVAAGTAGQVIVYELNEKEEEVTVPVSNTSVVD